MKPIPAGVRGFWALVVRPQHLAGYAKDLNLPPVLGTPVMIMLMGNATLHAIRQYLEPNETAIVTRVDIRRRSPTVVGTRVRAEAHVTRVDDRRVEFWVSMRDENGEIGAGRSERVVIDHSRMEQLLATTRPTKGDIYRSAHELHGRPLRQLSRE